MVDKTLQERLEEILAARKWTREDLMRITGASSSLVSQWQGKVGPNGRPMKTMGIQFALKLERESGYAAPWIAKGIGPKIAIKDRAWPFEDITLAELGALTERQLGALEMGMRDILEKLGLRAPRAQRQTRKNVRR